MRILVLDDDEVRHERFAEVFKTYDIKHVWTYDEACHALEHLGPWDLVYLDHDLNDFEAKSMAEHEGPYGGYYRELTGFDVVRFITRQLAKEKHPPEVIVHSWNPGGARMMITELREHGIKCSYRMFNGGLHAVEENKEDDPNWVTVKKLPK